ncbi:unnamed protein product, partial [marine sediment metagenome]
YNYYGTIKDKIRYLKRKGEAKMGIEDYIRDIVREKVNERVGQEVSVMKRQTTKEIGDSTRYEMKAHEYRHHRHGEESPDEVEPGRAGVPWNDVEDERLRKELEMAITWMATTHSRTNGAIRARLQKHAEESLMETYV